MEALATANGPEMTTYSFCDCNFFSNYLMNLISSALSRETKSTVWSRFESSLEIYAGLFPVSDGVYSMIPCSKKFSSILLAYLEDLSENGDVAILSTLLNSVMSVTYLKANDCCYSIRHLKNLLHFSDQSNTVHVLAALHGRSIYMKLSLNFGLVKRLPEESFILYREAHKRIGDFITMVISNPEREINFLAHVIMKLVQHSFLRGKNLRCYKRIFLASVAVKTIQLRLMGQLDLAYEYISCLRMYFVATADPLLSVFEVKSLLFGCCKTIKADRHYNMFCQEFDTLMPECPARLEPRKLSDLVRCQVRQSLSNCNVLLPVAIEALDISNREKCFVLGDLIDLSSSV